MGYSSKDCCHRTSSAEIRRIAQLVDLLTPESFDLVAYTTIYQAAVDLYQHDKPTDLISLTSYLTDRKQLKQVGGQVKLVQLLKRTASAVNIDNLACLAIDKYQRRELIVAGHDLVKLGHDTTRELESIFDRSEEKIFNLSANKQDQLKQSPIGDCLATVVDRLSKRSSPAYPTGLADLDILIGGLVKQDLIVIAARASMGKTWLACQSGILDPNAV